MTDEKNTFLTVLKNYLNREKSVIPDNINRQQLYEYAVMHNIVGVLYNQTVDANLRGEYSRTIFQYVNREKALKEVEAALDKAGIEYFQVKGMVISAFYPKPQLRTMGDCDIVVKDKKNAARILSDVGFEIEADAGKEIHFSKAGIEFELHDKLLYEENFNEKLLQDFFNDCWTYVRDNRLDESFHFLFIIAHLRKHFLYEGVGFRLFMDAAVFSQQKLDWEWILKKLDELKLTGFTKTCFALIERWFKIRCPVGTADISDDFYEKATETIFKNGLYGGENSAYINSISRWMKADNKAAAFIRKIFPPYLKMMEKECYRKLLDGRPWLLPLAWIVRWFTSWRKTKNALGNLQRYDEIKNKQRQMKEWNV